MMDDPPFEPDRALFARWRDAAPAPEIPDALTLAAYAEGRLDETASEDSAAHADAGSFALVRNPAGIIGIVKQAKSVRNVATLPGPSQVR